jgi:hypothetical protein
MLARVNPHDIKPGVVYTDANVTVTTFAVQHGNLEACGYRFDTPGRRIVISGDTTPTQTRARHHDQARKGRLRTQQGDLADPWRDIPLEAFESSGARLPDREPRAISQRS